MPESPAMIMTNISAALITFSYGGLNLAVRSSGFIASNRRPDFVEKLSDGVYAMSGEEGFSALDLHFADLMGRLSDRPCVELDVAALLVSRQRAGGHICLPLHEMAGQPLPAVYRGLERAPEAEDWIKKLQGTDVVGAPGEFKPLILDEQGRLYLRRYWEYEKNAGRHYQVTSECGATRCERQTFAAGARATVPR